MELNAIEQYVINKMEALQQENAELKQQLAKKESDEDIVVSKVIKTYYTIHTGYICDSNYNERLNAYKNKDFKALSNSYSYYIDTCTWNIDFQVGDRVFALRVDGKDCTVMSPEHENSFPTREEAENELLKRLKQDLKNYAIKHQLVLDPDLEEDIVPPTGI